MNKMCKVILLLVAFIVVFLLGGLIVLKFKDEPKKNNKPTNNVELENNYIEEYDIKEMLKQYKDIEFNTNTVLEDVKLYGFNRLDINKIAVENGKLKYYTSDKTYTANNLYNVKYIDLATDNKTYSELLVYTSYGTYYFNTNGASNIVSEEEYNSNFKDGNKALYTLNDNILNLSFIKVNSSYITGIKSIKENDKSYFVVKTSDTYLLDYTKSVKYGLEMITSVNIGQKLKDYITLGEIGKDKKLKVNYDLSLTNNEVLKYEDNILYIDKAYLTKDAYYFESNNNLYKMLLSDFDNNKIIKYNTKEIEKISLDEEKTYQGDVITSTKQFIKVLYKDGTNEEIM